MCNSSLQLITSFRPGGTVTAEKPLCWWTSALCTDTGSLLPLYAHGLPYLPPSQRHAALTEVVTEAREEGLPRLSGQNVGPTNQATF